MENDFRMLFKSKSGQVWVGGKKGLFQITDNRLVEIKKANGERFRDIRAMTETAEGVIWIAAYNQGIFLSDGNKMLRQLTIADGLKSINIQTLTTAKNGDIWLGSSDKGAMVWRPQNRRFKQIGNQQGLPNNKVQSLSLIHI